MSGGASSIVLRLFRQRLVDSTFLFLLFLLLLLLLPSRNLEAEALFFGSSDSAAPKEVDPEIKDLVSPSLDEPID